MIDRENITRRVKATLVSALQLQIAPEEIADEELLFGEGDTLGIDSVTTLEFICALEEEFKIEVDDDDLHVERFTSVLSVVDYIEAELQSHVVH